MSLQKLLAGIKTAKIAGVHLNTFAKVFNPTFVGLSQNHVSELTKQLQELTEASGVSISKASIEYCIIQYLATQNFSDLGFKAMDKKDSEIRALKASVLAHIKTHIELSNVIEVLK